MIQILMVIILMVSCTTNSKKESGMVEKLDVGFTIEEKRFGIIDSTEIIQYIVKHQSGFEMGLLNYGCIMTHLLVPDRDDNYEDIILGFNSLDEYLESSPYYGGIIGRYGNRIENGRFSLDGKTYVLAKNNGPNHLHGGTYGFDKRIWTASPFVEIDKAGIKFSYTSPDGEEGYPGVLKATFYCFLTDKSELVFEYEAVTNQSTICNLTQHNYYNLSGKNRSNILDHYLKINADQITPVNASLIPTGEFMPVNGGAFDFIKLKRIGEHIDDEDDQIRLGGGYDHNFALTDRLGLHDCATVIDSASGRKMEIVTSEPGVQFYSGNFLDGSINDKYGNPCVKHFAFCLETQHFPNSPNQPNFPKTLLKPSMKYQSTTIHRFSVLD